jgi:beta-glucosidase
VKNTSQREGQEVVELYLSFPKSSVAPVRALRAFTRMQLAAGETKHVQFTLGARDLSQVTDKGDHVIAEGSYQIYLGGGQPGTSRPGTEAAFRIQGQRKLPE